MLIVGEGVTVRGGLKTENEPGPKERSILGGMSFRNNQYSSVCVQMLLFGMHIDKKAGRLTIHPFIYLSIH